MSCVIHYGQSIGSCSAFFFGVQDQIAYELYWVYTKQYPSQSCRWSVPSLGGCESQRGSSMESMQGKLYKHMLRSETPVSAHPLEPQSQACHSHFPIYSTTSLSRKSLCICSRVFCEREPVCVCAGCACVCLVCVCVCVCVCVSVCLSSPKIKWRGRPTWTICLYACMHVYMYIHMCIYNIGERRAHIISQ